MSVAIIRLGVEIGEKSLQTRNLGAGERLQSRKHVMLPTLPTQGRDFLQHLGAIAKAQEYLSLHNSPEALSSAHTDLQFPSQHQ